MQASRGQRQRQRDGRRTRGRSLERDAARAVFDALDTDGNETLDRDEFAAGMRSVGLPVPPSTLDALFADADADADGAVTFDEFVQFAVRRTEALSAVFDSLDINANNALNVAELRAGLATLGLRASDADVRALLARMDANGDGSLSFDEFRDFLLLLPAENVRAAFDYFVRTALDVGEVAGVPENLADQPVPAWKTLAAGSVSGAVSRTATAPMDRIKVILQAGSAGGAPKGGGMAATVRAVWAEGGLRAFWRGNGTNVIKVAPEGALKFLVYDRIKALIAADVHNMTLPERLMSGAVAGAVSCTAIYPLEIAKTRLAISKPGTYTGLIDCLASTARSTGVRSLYAGLGPSLAGIIPYAGIEMAAFNILKESYIARYHDAEPGVAVLLSCGAISSTAGQLVAYPLQVIRTRMQAQGLPGSPAPTPRAGALDVATAIYRSGGLRRFYSGLIPNFSKSLPAISISYATYSLALRHLSDHHTATS